MGIPRPHVPRRFARADPPPRDGGHRGSGARRRARRPRPRRPRHGQRHPGRHARARAPGGARSRDRPLAGGSRARRGERAPPRRVRTGDGRRLRLALRVRPAAALRPRRREPALRSRGRRPASFENGLGLRAASRALRRGRRARADARAPRGAGRLPPSRRPVRVRVRVRAGPRRLGARGSVGDVSTRRHPPRHGRDPAHGHRARL